MSTDSTTASGTTDASTVASPPSLPVSSISLTSVTAAASAVAAAVTTASRTVVHAVKSSGAASIDASAAAITTAVIEDVATIEQDANEVASAVGTTAAELYQSPLSTILTICGRTLLKDTPMSSANIILIAHNVMESIESLKTLQVMKNMTSDQKKQLAIDCLHWMVNNNDELSLDEKEAVNLLIDTVVPNTIDTMIAISNGISELGGKCKSCCIIA